MALDPSDLRSFFAELRRRHVFRVTAVYALVAFTVAQAAAVAFPALQLPGWTLSFVVVLALLGLPVAVVLAWSFQMSPEGVTRTAVAVAPTAPDVALPQGARGPETGDIRHAAVAAPPATRSIAVLPFADMSPDGDQEYLSDGITEELLNALTKVERLRVPARTSSFAFKGKDLDIREIGARLNVETVLEGSVRKAGDRVRITAQLINVADGYHIWSERYDREMEDSFAIQDDITRRIVEALEVTLTEREERAIKTTRARDIRAYEYYLRGRQFFHQMRRRTLEFARQMFTRAIEADPVYAPAYAGLSDVLSCLYNWFGHDRTLLREADEASARAVELDPELAEAHAARAYVLSLGKRYPEAERELETALRLDPRLFEAYYYYGRVCFVQEELDRAARLFEQASRVRPEDYQVVCLLSMVYRAMERSADANAAATRALEVIDAHLALNPDDARAVYMGALCLVDLGEHERAREWAARAVSMDSEDAGVLYNVACVFAKLGDTDKALRALERAVESGSADRAWVEHDPDFADLRAHPRFQALLERL